MEKPVALPHPTDLLDLPPSVRLYSSNSIWLTMLFTGPFGATFMIAKNFVRFGAPQHVKFALLGALVLLALEIWGDDVPMLADVPSWLVNIACTFATFICVKIWQQKQIDHHLAIGGGLESRGTVLLVNLVAFSCLVVFIGIVLALEDSNAFMETMRSVFAP
ncbi:MAG: hypothetical protein EAY75_10525 [Bacteroidetes bacterium]|nr:MAG: hypothetical protein EAY75_10525 [Bacteroidota bacterium]